ncbi:MAG: PQQ-binding-like beta-propeller repeat protein [Nitrososphaerota archaeon]|nr:PQQ-binding-like beta-propeller repeat protein [Nitrososphaerota archaeon]
MKNYGRKLFSRNSHCLDAKGLFTVGQDSYFQKLKKVKKKMQAKLNKIVTIAIALMLAITMVISFETFSLINAQTTYPIPGRPNDTYNLETYTAIQEGMHWTGMVANASAARLTLWNRFHDKIPTYCFLLAAPSPIGVGQTNNVVMFNPQTPPGATLNNNIRYQFKLQVTTPSGKVINLPTSAAVSGFQTTTGTTFVSDSTGSTYYSFTPDEVGNYTLTVTFMELNFMWNTTSGASNNDYYGTTFLSSNYTTTLVVQEEPIALSGLTPPAISPIPTEYWTRPIEGQNTPWYTVASNWLANAHDRDNGGAENRYQPDGTAPNSGHILWTKPTEDLGVLGGSNTGENGQVFNAGAQYQPRFMNQIIMYGRLYYSPNIFSSGGSDLMNCLDLKTGKQIYQVNTTALVGSQFQLTSYAISQGLSNAWFGYYYDQEDANEHGIQNPGWLFTPNYGRALQPATGIVSNLNIINVPSTAGVFEAQGPKGENLRYSFVNKGTANNPSYYLSQWNSSKTIPGMSAYADPSANVINAGLATRFDWNISSPIQFTTAPSVRAAKVGDIIWGTNGTWPTGSGAPSYTYPAEVTIWAISIAPDSLGRLLYMKNLQIDDPVLNTNLVLQRADANNNVFVALVVQTGQFVAFNMRTGEQLWKTDQQAYTISPYGYYTWSSLIGITQTKIAYDLLYTAGYTGTVSAYHLSNGTLAWRHEVIPPGTAGYIKSSPAMMALIADGKLYVGSHEHSAMTPLDPGNRLKCLNATTGESIWQMSGWVYPESIAVADGVLVYWNDYDGQLYAVGQGPTAMTVTAPNTASPVGTPVVIRGTVIDVSAGTQQDEQAARFPHGVPAVSDESMSGWMEYVYMQKASPANVTGVPVSIYVIDGNNNYRHIGDTTSDASGMFTYAWKPDIEGPYTVKAVFEGSQSYYGSAAESSFYASQEVTPEALTQLPTGLVTTADLLLYIGAVIAVNVVLIAIVAFLVLKKR